MDIWSFIYNEISINNKVVLITVVERNGSSPGVVGFKMAVSENGSMKGSIGGGVMEYNMVELSKKIAKDGNIKTLLKRQIHNPDAGKDKSGLTCSGEQTQSFTLIDKTNISTIKSIIDILNEGNCGILKLNEKGMLFEIKTDINQNISFNSESENNWEYIEHIGLKPTLYIFGAGHVSVPLSQIFRAIDFKVVVFDNREGLSTFENNEYAHQKHIIDFKNIGNVVPEKDSSYAVIMTVGHKSDELVLEQLINKKIKYLGMIGSKNKVKNIFDSLLQKGISEKALAKVDSPIGLSINSKTTPEIAISIAAKVIQIKNS